jgi:hypothetical protein
VLESQGGVMDVTFAGLRLPENVCGELRSATRIQGRCWIYDKIDVLWMSETFLTSGKRPANTR